MIKKSKFVLFTLILLCTFTFTNVSKISAIELVPSGTTCDDIDQVIQDRSNYYESLMQSGASSVIIRLAKMDLDNAIQWKKDNCTTCQPSGYAWSDTGYKDSRGWVIGRFRTPGGYEAFCVEPEGKFNSCADYQLSGNGIPASKRDQIARIVYGYNKTNKSNEHYVAAQLLIWEALGRSDTANGSSMSQYKDEILANGRSEELYIHKDVDMKDKSYIVNLGDTVTDIDKNSELHNNYFNLETSNGVKATKNENKINATLDDIYPLTKTIKINGKETERVSGNVDAGTSFTNPNWQDFFTFEGNIDSLKYTTFKGDEITLKIATGDFALNKVDEFGDNAGSGIKFNVWYAKEDTNGTAIDTNGTKWAKYKPFQTESDWNNGVAQSTFTTNNEGKFTIELPSGGKFSDNTPIGTYIIQEVDTTNPFLLNEKEYVFKVEENSTTTLTVSNELRIVNLEIIKKDAEEPGNMSDEEIKLNGATYEIYDVSSLDGKTMDTNDGKNPIINNYFLKVGKTVDLNTFLNSDSLVSSLTGTKSYEIANKHCNTATLEGANLTANKTDILKVNVLEDNTLKTTITIYLINDDNTLGNEDSFIIKGIGQFRGETGRKYEQLVDVKHHYLPIANEYLTVYYDETLNEPYKKYQSDIFGMISFKNGEALDGTDDNDGTFYYNDSEGNKKTITQAELDDYKGEKGTLTTNYLKHSRKYMVCESSTPANYDLVNGTNACYFLTTDYAKDEKLKSNTLENRKGRGDLEVQKLNEWLEPAGEGIKFKLYHAKLQDTGLSYEENWENVELDQYNRPIKGDLVLNPTTGEEYFTVNAEGKINLYDHLYFGYYILEEFETTDPFVKNDELTLIKVQHSKTTNVEFVNENRTVSFDVFKYDVEEEFRKLNDAEFTIYDISDTLDNDLIKTQIGMQTPLTDEDIDMGFNSLPVSIENMYFAKLGSQIDLYDWILKGTEAEQTINSRPIKYNLSHGNVGIVDVDGIYTPTRTGYVDIEIVGGAYNLYGTAGDLTVYLGQMFNPYDNLEFYEDEAKTKPINIETITYTGDLDINTVGEYTLHYTLISKAHVKYEFDRKVSVVEDTRHVCKFNAVTNDYRYVDTNEECDEIDPGMSLDYATSTFTPIILTDKEVADNWEGRFVTRVRIYNVTDDNKISETETKFNIDGLPVFRGLTGHSYIQLVDYENHNLPLGNQELITYYDKELKYPYKRYVSDDMGMVDLGSEGELLAGKPIPTLDSDGSYYIPYAKKSEVKSCEYAVGYTYDETLDKCVNESGSQKPYQIVTKYEEAKQPLPYYDPELDSSFSYPNELTDVYYSDQFKTELDGTKTPVIKHATVLEEKGHIEVPHLKHSRKYLVCETALPEGYDYDENQNACFVLNTKDYEPGIENKSDSVGNKLRRVDVVLIKSNFDKTIKLNGAEFDIWENFEEGLDMNEINGSINSLGIKETLQGTMFYEDEILGTTDEIGACEFYGTDEKLIPSVGVDSSLNETDKDQPVGKCYKKYEPDTVGKKYLGHFISGGIYQKFIDKPNHLVEIATDKEFNNIIKQMATNSNGEIKINHISKGTYYIRLKRPLKDTFVAEKVDANGNIIIHTPTPSDYVDFTELDPIYQEVRVTTTDEGSIILPDIKYGHSLLFTETKAPDGYYFDNPTFTIVPKSEYGIKIMENYRPNMMIIIKNTGADK